MLVLAMVVLLAAGVLLIVKRAEVTSLHNAVMGARFPVGCAVAEGLFVIALAAVMAILYLRGWFE